MKRREERKGSAVVQQEQKTREREREKYETRKVTENYEREQENQKDKRKKATSMTVFTSLKPTCSSKLTKIEGEHNLLLVLWRQRSGRNRKKWPPTDKSPLQRLSRFPRRLGAVMQLITIEQTITSYCPCTGLRSKMSIWRILGCRDCKSNARVSIQKHDNSWQLIAPISSTFSLAAPAAGRSPS